VTEAEWLAATEPQAMLTFLRNSGRACERKLRLFACGCARRVGERVPQLADAADLVERNADSLARAEEFRRQGDPEMVHPQGSRLSFLGSRDSGEAASGTSMWVAYLVTSQSMPQADPDPRWLSELAAHADLVREIFGSPFRPAPTIDPGLLHWNGGTVARLAREAYEDRILPSGLLKPVRLGVLADAMEEAGVDADVVGHLRGPGPHVRGCWAVDLLLGKG
jgi:hypothetical protein